MKESTTVGLDLANNVFQGPSVKGLIQWINRSQGRGRCRRRGCRPSACEARTACAVPFPAATLPDRHGGLPVSTARHRWRHRSEQSPVVAVVQRGAIGSSPLDDGSSPPATADPIFRARELTRFGHEVRLIPPSYVTLFVKRGKTGGEEDRGRR